MMTAADILAAQKAGDVDTLAAIALKLLGALEYSAVTKRPAKRPPGADTWMTAYAKVWEAEMGDGSFPFGPAAKPLQKLLKAGHTEATICRNLSYYLRDARRRDGIQYANIASFCKTFATWSPDSPAFPEDG